MPITHEGKEYFSSEEVTNTVKDRLRSAVENATQWEQKYKAAEPELAKVSTLASELDGWKQKATKAEGTFARYQAAATHGVTDPDTIWALEQAHERAMAGVEEAKRVDFGGYLATAKADPSIAPSYLRHVFGTPTAVTPPPTAGQTQASVVAAPVVATPRPPWAPAMQGQTPVQPGQRQAFTDRVNGAKTLEDLAALQQERLRSRR